MPSVVVEDCAVATRDGVALATQVFRRGGGQRSPAALVRTPYGIHTLRATIDPVALVGHGFAAVLQDVRGRYGSGGHFAPFEREGPDGADSVRWCARQPWCDGRVVMFGSSYAGSVQLLAALEQPGALRSIAPFVAAGDVDSGWLREAGAYRVGFIRTWLQSLAASDPRASATARRAAAAIGRNPITLAARGRDDPALRRAVPLEQAMLERPRAAWRRVDAIRRAHRVGVPAYLVTGWYDIFCESALATYAALTRAGDADAGPPRRLIIGPWTHTGVGARQTAGFDFGPRADGAHLGSLVGSLDWVRAVLDHADVQTGVAAYVSGADTWVELPSWPPPATRLTWYLGDGTLLETAPEPGWCNVSHDPRRPVETRGGRLLGPYLPPAGPVEQAPARRGTVAYYSEPLTRPLDVAGTVTATLTVSSSAPECDVAVTLLDVLPDGRSFNVVDSVRRITGGPSGPRPITVDVGTVAQRFGRGHRVAMIVAGSNFPRLDVTAHAATHRIHHGGRWPSALHLPASTVLSTRGVR